METKEMRATKETRAQTVRYFILSGTRRFEQSRITAYESILDDSSPAVDPDTSNKFDRLGSKVTAEIVYTVFVLHHLRTVKFHTTTHRSSTILSTIVLETCNAVIRTLTRKVPLQVVSTCIRSHYRRATLPPTLGGCRDAIIKLSHPHICRRLHESLLHQAGASQRRQRRKRGQRR